MADPFSIYRSISKVLHYIACIALTMMMFLTVADVAFRAGGRPFVGTYEIVALLLAVVVGFGIPQVSLDKGHVSMEFLLEKLPKRGRDAMNILTRALCLILFVLIGYNLFNVASGFHRSGEVTPTIQLPFHPVAYGVAVCCLLESFVFIFDIVRICRGQHE